MGGPLWYLKRQGFLAAPVILEPSKEKYVVGRVSSSEIQLPSNFVSKIHACLRWNQDYSRWTISEPRASLNGTFVNKEKIEENETKVLQNGDMIGFGVKEVTENTAELMESFPELPESYVYIIHQGDNEEMGELKPAVNGISENYSQPSQRNPESRTPVKQELQQPHADDSEVRSSVDFPVSNQNKVEDVSERNSDDEELQSKIRAMEEEVQAKEKELEALKKVAYKYKNERDSIDSTNAQDHVSKASNHLPTEVPVNPSVTFPENPPELVPTAVPVNTSVTLPENPPKLVPTNSLLAVPTTSITVVFGSPSKVVKEIPSEAVSTVATMPLSPITAVSTSLTSIFKEEHPEMSDTWEEVMELDNINETLLSKSRSENDLLQVLRKEDDDDLLSLNDTDSSDEGEVDLEGFQEVDKEDWLFKFNKQRTGSDHKLSPRQSDSSSKKETSNILEDKEEHKRTSEIFDNKELTDNKGTPIDNEETSISNILDARKNIFEESEDEEEFGNKELTDTAENKGTPIDNQETSITNILDVQKSIFEESEDEEETTGEESEVEEVIITDESETELCVIEEEFNAQKEVIEKKSQVEVVTIEESESEQEIIREELKAEEFIKNESSFEEISKEETIAEGSNAENQVTEKKSKAEKKAIRNVSEADEEIIGEKSEAEEVVILDEAESDEKVIREKSKAEEKVAGKKSEVDGEVIGEASEIEEAVITDRSKAAEEIVGKEPEAEQKVIGKKSEADGEIIGKESEAKKVVIANRSKAAEEIVEDKSEAGQEVIGKKSETDGEELDAEEVVITDRSKAAEEIIRNESESEQEVIRDKQVKDASVLNHKERLQHVSSSHDRKKKNRCKERKENLQKEKSKKVSKREANEKRKKEKSTKNLNKKSEKKQVNESSKCKESRSKLSKQFEEKKSKKKSKDKESERKNARKVLKESHTEVEANQYHKRKGEKHDKIPKTEKGETKRNKHHKITKYRVKQSESYPERVEETASQNHQNKLDDRKDRKDVKDKILDSEQDKYSSLKYQQKKKYDEKKENKKDDVKSISKLGEVRKRKWDTNEDAKIIDKIKNRTIKAQEEERKMKVIDFPKATTYRRQSSYLSPRDKDCRSKKEKEEKYNKQRRKSLPNESQDEWTKRKLDFESSGESTKRRCDSESANDEAHFSSESDRRSINRAYSLDFGKESKYMEGSSSRPSTSTCVSKNKDCKPEDLVKLKESASSQSIPVSPKRSISLDSTQRESKKIRLSRDSNEDPVDTAKQLQAYQDQWVDFWKMYKSKTSKGCHLMENSVSKEHVNRHLTFHEILKNILKWNFRWIKEQREQTTDDSRPPVLGFEISMKNKEIENGFSSFEHYQMEFYNLLLLDLWEKTANAYSRKVCGWNMFRRAEMNFKKSDDALDLDLVSCTLQICAEDRRDRYYWEPQVGDLALWEYCKCGSDKMDMCFIYIDQVTVTGQMNNEVTLTFYSRHRPIEKGSRMRLLSLINISEDLRILQGLHGINDLALTSAILQPRSCEQTFAFDELQAKPTHCSQDSNMVHEIVAESLKQTCSEEFLNVPKLLMVQTPPGTGRTNLIRRIVFQLLSEGHLKPPDLTLDPKPGGRAGPSKVVHIRNIPKYCTNKEVIQLGDQFGRVTNYVIFKQNQALLEMENEVAASSMVNSFNTCAAQLRNETVYVQFSNYKHLPKHQTNTDARQRILLCTPTDYIADELVYHLNYNRGQYHKLVYNGYTNCSSPEVRNSTLAELVKAYKAVKGIDPDVYQSQLELEKITEQIFRIDVEIKEKKKSTASNRESENVNDLEELRRGLIKKKDAVDSKLENMKKNRDEHELQLEVLRDADLVVSTLTSCRSPIMQECFENRHRPFTCCIVVDAERIKEVEIFQPLSYHVNKLLLLGDIRQLPPPNVTSPVSQKNGLSRSLLQRLHEEFRDKSPVIMLSHQYDMHPQIMQFPSSYFYNNRLTTVDWFRKGPIPPYLLIDFGAGKEVEGDGSFKNPLEGSFVSLLVNTLLTMLRRRNERMSVGVVSPYTKQCQYILDELHVKYNIKEEVTVRTVSDFQGLQKEIVIVSCVRTDVKQALGFVSGKQGLNVSLTRARCCLVICGHFESHEQSPEWRHVIRDAHSRKVFRRVRGKGIHMLPSEVEQLLKFD